MLPASGKTAAVHASRRGDRKTGEASVSDTRSRVRTQEQLRKNKKESMGSKYEQVQP